MLVGSHVNIAPAKVACLHRPHAGIGHNQRGVVGHRPIPFAEFRGPCLDPATGEGMQMAVFLSCGKY